MACDAQCRAASGLSESFCLSALDAVLDEPSTEITVTGTTIGGSNVFGGACWPWTAAELGPDRVVQYRAPYLGTYRFDLDGSSPGLHLLVKDCEGTIETCDEGSYDGAAGSVAGVSLRLQRNQVIAAVIDSTDTASAGAFRLNITVTEATLFAGAACEPSSATLVCEAAHPCIGDLVDGHHCAYACENGLDDDGDGATDVDDTDCASALDDSEGAAAPSAPVYLGCYTDDSSRALPTNLMSSGATVESCTAAARAAGLRYAGLQSYGYCFAGNTLGYVQVSEAECTTPCSANPSQTCGGSWRNSVYDVGVAAEP